MSLNVRQDDLVGLFGVLSPAELIDIGEDLRPTISSLKGAEPDGVARYPGSAGRGSWPYRPSSEARYGCAGSACPGPEVPTVSSEMQ
jgi:hypothetical protein